MSAIGMPRAHPQREPSPAVAGVGLRSRVSGWFGVGADWVRPRPVIGPADWALVIGLEALGLVSLELLRSVGALTHTDAPVWVQWLAVSTGALLLLGRRRWPLVVALLAAAHMFVVGVTLPQVMAQFTLQVAYFVAFYSAVAWARDRTAMVVVVSAIVVFMFGWIAWQFALGSAISEMLADTDLGKAKGVVPPVVAGVALTLLINVIYFAGALVGGQSSWNAARQRARLEEQAETIGAQSVALLRQAVLDERLRIARELHDVVGHHVSVIGVQAGAARRVLTKDPAAATRALTSIETSSRDAVQQMRGLLGTLRDIESVSGDPAASTVPASSAAPTAEHRAPEPGVGDLPALVDSRRAAGLEVSYDLIEDPPGAAGDLPGPVSLTLYRIGQEALANVARHSTARSARLVVRVERAGTHPFAEVEVVDDGRPRPGTSGSGLGQLGIRERAQSLGALVDIGPRVTGGYRVRVRIPLGEG